MSTYTKKPTRTYVTGGFQTLTATRTNPEHRAIYGRRYDVAVDGEVVGTLFQTGRDKFTFPAMQGTSYITTGGLDERLLFCAADSMTTLAPSLPLDLDGHPYRDGDLGPWKVSACCGAYYKGTEDGVVCRSCYGDGGDSYDGPARLPVPTSPEDPRPVRQVVKVTTIRPCDRHWTGDIPDDCPDCVFEPGILSAPKPEPEPDPVIEPDARVDGGQVVDALVAAGVHAILDHTGGGNFTVYAYRSKGQSRAPGQAVLVGPFYATDDTYEGIVGDTYVGVEDDDDDFAAVMSTDVRDVVQLVTLYLDRVVRCSNPDHDHDVVQEADRHNGLCGHCFEPVHYDRTIEDYLHTDPEADPCFLCQVRPEGATACTFPEVAR